jgi:Mn2+/Fe2+ NRAMP family transporter
MRRIFLGKPLHWGLVAILIVVGWLLGREKLHVIWFNLFTIILLALSAAVVAVVLMTSKPGEQITRDPLEQDED